MTLKVLLTDYLRSCDVFIEMETVGHDPYKKALMWGAFLDIGIVFKEYKIFYIKIVESHYLLFIWDGISFVIKSGNSIKSLDLLL